MGDLLPACPPAARTCVLSQHQHRWVARCCWLPVQGWLCLTTM